MAIETVRSSLLVAVTLISQFHNCTGGFTDIGSTMIDERPDTGYGSFNPEQTKSTAS